MFSSREWPKPLAPRLSPRELQILNILAAGHSNKVIAHQAFITKDTVKYHLKNLYQKLGVRNRFEALVVASNTGLLKGPTSRS